MKKIINEYIIKAETLLLIRPNNKMVKSYLLRLKSLRNIPNIRLIGFEEAIPLVYKILESEENISQSRVTVKLFSVMVTNARTAAAADKIKAKYPDFVYPFLGIE